MATCPSCGEEAGDGLFCGHCGAKVPAETASSGVAAEAPPVEAVGWTCAQCGAGNDVDARFCYACGGASQTGAVGTAPAAQQSASRDWTCASCGAIGEEDSDFCYTCGTARPGLAPSAVEGVPASVSPATGPDVQPAQAATIAADTTASTTSAPPADKVTGLGADRLPWVIAAIVVVALVAAGVAYMVGRGGGSTPPAAQTVTLGADTSSSGGGTGAAAGSGDSTSTGGSTSTSGSTASDTTATFLNDMQALIVQAGHGREGIAKATTAYSHRSMSADRAAGLIQAVIDNRNSVLKKLRAMPASSNGAAEGCRPGVHQGDALLGSSGSALSQLGVRLGKHQRRGPGQPGGGVLEAVVRQPLQPLGKPARHAPFLGGQRHLTPQTTGAGPDGPRQPPEEA